MITIRVAIAVALVLPATLAGQTQPRTYDQLLALFKEWRSFEEPPRLAGGVPDYTPATNAQAARGASAHCSRAWPLSTGRVGRCRSRWITTWCARR